MAWLWSRYGHRVNLGLFFQVTAVFLLVFVVQLLIYGFHELTEANIFPYSEPLHWATEPYGPDGRYGRVSDLPARDDAARLAGLQQPDAASGRRSVRRARTPRRATRLTTFERRVRRARGEIQRIFSAISAVSAFHVVLPAFSRAASNAVISAAWRSRRRSSTSPGLGDLGIRRPQRPRPPSPSTAPASPGRRRSRRSAFALAGCMTTRRRAHPHQGTPSVPRAALAPESPIARRTSRTASCG